MRARAHMHTHTDPRAHRRTHAHTHTQTDKDRHAPRHAHTHIHKPAGAHMHAHTHRLRRRFQRHAHTHKHARTHGRTHGPTDPQVSIIASLFAISDRTCPILIGGFASSQQNTRTLYMDVPAFPPAQQACAPSPSGPNLQSILWDRLIECQ